MIGVIREDFLEPIIDSDICPPYLVRAQPLYGRAKQDTKCNVLFFSICAHVESCCAVDLSCQPRLSLDPGPTVPIPSLLARTHDCVITRGVVHRIAGDEVNILIEYMNYTFHQTSILVIGHLV
jgi:hypothetical protein